MSNAADPISELFNSYLGKDDKYGYHCNKCDYEMDVVPVQTTMQRPRRFFYCRNNKCERFGLLTVVAKTKPKR